jgi:hypothetical protein
MDNQPTNDKPWAENLLEVFGFGKKNGGTPTPVPSEINAQKPIYDQPEALWQMYKPKPMSNFENLFSKVIQAESQGKHRDAQGNLTKSKVGALGITQIMPATGRDPGYGVAPLRDDSEAEYLRVGKELLQAYTKEFGGDIRKGLAAYNAGIGKVQKTISEHGEEWETKLPAETKNYLSKILGTATGSRQANAQSPNYGNRVDGTKKR